MQTYRYDEDGNLVSATQTGTGTENAEYAANGVDLLQYTAANGTKYTYEYNDAHDVTKTTVGSLSVNTNYNDAGNVTSSKLTATGTTKYMESTAVPTADQNRTSSVTDASGNPHIFFTEQGEKMGTFFTSMALSCGNTTKEEIVDYFRTVMIGNGYKETTDDLISGTEVCFCHWKNSPWISIVSDLFDNLQFSALSRVAVDASGTLGTEVLAIACVDSDALIIRDVDKGNGHDLSFVVGAAREYGIKASNTHNAWKKKFGDITDLKRIVKTDYTFAEDALESLSPYLNISPEQGRLSSGSIAEAPDCEVVTLRFQNANKRMPGRRYFLHLENFDEEVQTALQKIGFQYRKKTWCRLTDGNVLQMIQLGYDHMQTLTVYSEPLYGRCLPESCFTPPRIELPPVPFDLLEVHHAIQGIPCPRHLVTFDFDEFQTFPQVVHDAVMKTLIPLLESAVTPAGNREMHNKIIQFQNARQLGLDPYAVAPKAAYTLTYLDTCLYYEEYDACLSMIHAQRELYFKVWGLEREKAIERGKWTADDEEQYNKKIEMKSTDYSEEYGLALSRDRGRIRDKLQKQFAHNQALIAAMLNFGVDAVLTFPEELLD